jgi:hypothetical protein
MIQISSSRESSVFAICPWCGDVWAKVSTSDTSWFRHHYAPCINHPKANFAYDCQVAGSLLEVDPNLIHELPEDYIRREFVLHLKAAETGAL